MHWCSEGILVGLRQQDVLTIRCVSFAFITDGDSHIVWVESWQLKFGVLGHNRILDSWRSINSPLIRRILSSLQLSIV